MKQSDLLERQNDLAQLEKALDRANAGSGSIVLVSGEAGIGKTSLVEHFAQQKADVAGVLRGYCDPLLTPSTLGPLHDVATQLGGELPRLLDDESKATAIFSFVLSSLEGRAKPTIFIIEDLHWADGATLDMVKYLARRLDSAQILVIATFRDDELQVHDPLRVLLGNLANEPGVERIHLDRLSKNAVAELAQGQIADVDLLFQKTSGNPFFVSEVIANPDASLPQSVRDAVLGRAARLSDAGSAVLDRAAVIGARIEYTLLEAFADSIQEGLAECLGLGILQDSGMSVGFRHELSRNAILERIEPLRRRALYREILAAAVKAGFAERGRFARLAHYAEGAFLAHDVVVYGIKAAQAAAAAGSHREAAAHYESVLRFSEDMPPAERAGYFSAFASECAVVDRLTDAAEAYRNAVALWSAAGEHLHHGAALAALAWPLVRNGENAAADASAEEAIALLEPLGQSLELANAYRVKAHLHMLDRDRDHAVEFGQKAIEIASHLGDKTVLAASELVVGAAMLVFDDPDGKTRLDRSLEIARAEGLDEITALVHVNAGSAYGEQYHFTQAEAELLQGLAFTKENDLDHSGHYLSAWLAMTYLFQGKWQKATEISKALIAQPNISAVSRIVALVTLGRVLVRQGDPGASEVLDEALALSIGTGTLQRLAPVHAARAENAWFDDDRDAVANEANAVLDMAVGRRHAWHTGEFLYWLRLAGHNPSNYSWVAEPYALQIADNWKEAARSWRKRGCPYEEARALACGDEEGQLRALAIFDKLGAAPAAGGLRQQMRLAGHRHIPRGPRQSTRQNPFGLTAREMTTLGYLVSGLSNAQIADALFISPKTVDHHVSAILGKLGVASRFEAAEKAIKEGLVSQNGEGSAPK